MGVYDFNIDVVINIFLQWFGFITSYFVFRVNFQRALILQTLYIIVKKYVFFINRKLNHYTYNYFNTEKKWESLDEIMRNDQRVFCVLTGGCHGLGKQLCTKIITKYALQHENFELLVIDKDPLDISEYSLKNVHFIKHDFSTRIGDKLKNFQDATYDYKIVINNCGYRFGFQDFLSSWDDSSRFFQLMNINTISACDLLHCFKPDYTITISSILSMISPKNGFLYSATKSVLSNMHESYVQIENKRGLLVLPGQLEGTTLFKDFEPLFKDNFKHFLSPLVNIYDLSEIIMDGLENLENRCIVTPYYGYFMKILSFMPYWIQKPLRVMSSVDAVEN